MTSRAGEPPEQPYCVSSVVLGLALVSSPPLANREGTVITMLGADCPTLWIETETGHHMELHKSL